MRFTGSISLLLTASMAAAVAVPEPNPGSANVIQQRADPQLNNLCEQFTYVGVQVEARMNSELNGWAGSAHVRTTHLSILRRFC